MMHIDWYKAGGAQAMRCAGMMLVGATLVVPGYGAMLWGVAKRLPLWLGLAGALVLVEVVMGEAAAAARMLAFIAVLFGGMKAIVYHEYRLRGNRALGWREYFAFCFLWFGMNPRCFDSRHRVDMSRSRRYVIEGVGALIAGGGLIAISPWLGTWGDWVFIVGGSLVLHFGAFKLIAVFWRAQGYPCRLLFRNPLKATSLRDFWSKRWNLGYVEMMAVVFFQPLRGRLSARWAGFFSFIVSGVFHELAISVPVHKGYGLPTLYFTIHGFLVMGRDQRWCRAINDSWWAQKLWTTCWLVAPLPILFPESFRAGVIAPAIQTVSAFFAFFF